MKLLQCLLCRHRKVTMACLLCLCLLMQACSGSLRNVISSDDASAESDRRELEAAGDLLRERGELQTAFVNYEKALKLSPDDPVLIYKEGLVSLAADRNDDALKDFNRVIAINPEYAPAWEGAGEAFFRKGDMDKARDAFYRALQLDPTLWKCHNKLGLIYDRRGRHGPAILEYRQAIELNPRDGALYNNLGLSYTYNQEYDAAVNALNRAIELNYAEKKVYNNLGLALGLMQRYDAALEAFRKAGSEAQARNNLGVVYLNQNKYEKAIEAFEKAIELEPSYYTTAGENLKKARLAIEQQQ